MNSNTDASRQDDVTATYTRDLVSQTLRRVREWLLNELQTSALADLQLLTQLCSLAHAKVSEMGMTFSGLLSHVSEDKSSEFISTNIHHKDQTQASNNRGNTAEQNVGTSMVPVEDQIKQYYSQSVLIERQITFLEDVAKELDEYTAVLDSKLRQRRR